MKRVYRLALALFMALALLLVTAGSIFAVPFYVPDGEFNSATSWESNLNWEINIVTDPECYEPPCANLNEAGYYIYQYLESPQPYVIMGAYVYDDGGGQVCLSVRQGPSYGQECSENGGAWVTLCTSELTPGEIQIRITPSSSADYYVDNVFVDYVAECPEEITPPPPPNGEPSIPLEASCFISSTNQTISANILSNYSFETGTAYVPEEWTNNTPIVWPDVYKTDNPHEGSKVIWSQNSGAFNLTQSTSLTLTPGTYLAGVMVNWDDTIGANVSVSFGGESGSIISGTVYQPLEITATISTTGTQSFVISVPDTTGLVGDVHIDSAYLFPISGTAELNCPLLNEAVEATNGISGTVPPPLGGGGGFPAGICYTCQIPDTSWNLAFYLGAWIYYLYCQISNLFFCYLYNWIYSVFNVAMGAYNLVYYLWNGLMATIENFWGWVASAWANGMDFTEFLWGLWGDFWQWVYDNAQGFINWFIGLVLGFAIFLDPGYWFNLLLNNPFIQYAIGWILWLIDAIPLADLLIRAIVTIFWNVVDALKSLVELISVVVEAIRGSFTSEAYEIVIITEGGGEVSTIDPGALAAEGINATKALWAVLISISAIDYFVEIFPEFHLVLVLTVGILCLSTAMWTFKTWENGLPI